MTSKLFVWHCGCMKDSQVIEALGGWQVVAKKLDISDQQAVHFWRRAIPYKYRPAIKRLAKAKRIKLPADFLETRRG